MFYVHEFKALYTANSGRARGFTKHARLDATTIARTASRHNHGACVPSAVTIARTDTQVGHHISTLVQGEKTIPP